MILYNHKIYFLSNVIRKSFNEKYSRSYLTIKTGINSPYNLSNILILNNSSVLRIFNVFF